MSTTTDISVLKLNYLTQTQYDEALGNNLINADEIYLTPAESVGALVSTDDENGNVGLSYSIEDLGGVVTELVDLVYPVGSIYMSVNDVSPATLFGGEWEKIRGRMLFGAYDSGELTAEYDINSDTSYGNYTTGSSHISDGWEIPLGVTGGEYFHTLTTDEMPSHRHISGYQRSVYPSNGSAGAMISWEASGATTVYAQQAGGGQRHSNMPPFLAVNIWKRTG